MTNSLPTPAEAGVQPQETTCYSSKYLADYYDMWIGDWRDVDLYSERLAALVSQTSGKVTVLDIGTGSGRIIHGLLASAQAQAHGLFAGVHFVGLDNEPHMLERARRFTDPSLPANQVEWLLGSAEDLESLPALSQAGGGKSPAGGPGSVDMLTFACGSICHLHEPGQGERFFRQLARTLKPRTGRAYISVLKMLSDGGAADARAAQPSLGANHPVPSRTLPGIVYRETWPRHELIGKVWHTARHIVVSQVQPDGTETVIEYNLGERKARVWTESDLRAAANAAGGGLHLVEVITQKGEVEGQPEELIFVWGVDVDV